MTYSWLRFCVAVLLGSCASNAELFPANDRTLWGYIDESNTFKIDPEYDAADLFRDGLGCVRKRGYWGCLTASGTLSVPFELKIRNSPRFSEGVAAVSIDTEFGWRWGYVNRSGEFIIPPTYQNAQPFSSGLAAVKEGDKSFFIDMSGKPQFSKYFEDALSFASGLAAVRIRGLYAYIDRQGRQVIEPQFKKARGFSHGLAAVQFADKTGMWIYINQAGKQAIRQTFHEARDFSEGLAPISTFPYWGFVDTAGRIRVQPRYASVGAFVQGRANVTFRRPYKASRSGYIDVFGILVIPDTFEQGSDFLPSGRAAVFVVRGEQFAKGYAGWGSLAYIDTSGQILWPKEAR